MQRFPPRRQQKTTGKASGLLGELSAVAAANSPVSTEKSSRVSHKKDDHSIEEMIKGFQDMFFSGIDLEDKDLAELKAQFGDAMRQAATEPVDIDTLTDRSNWVSMVDDLLATGLVGEDESNTLIRKLDQAMEPLQNPRVKLAIEFGRRCQEEGEEKALQWYQTQIDMQAASSNGATARESNYGNNNQISHRDAITRSRSRTLRGPPR